jgi:multiple sugar transport system permease protein
MTLLPKGLNSVSSGFEPYMRILLSDSTYKVSQAELNQMISTGTLMAIVPLLVLYLFAQKAFVESLSQTGIKM